MYESIKKDGIYEIEPNLGNPYARYLVVRTYGDKQKRRMFTSLDDCRQQIEEWNSDFLKENRELPFPDPRANLYSISNESGTLYAEGTGEQIAKMVGCMPKTVCNAANTAGRRLKLRKDEQTIYLNVTKLTRQSRYAAAMRLCTGQ